MNCTWKVSWCHVSMLRLAEYITLAEYMIGRPQRVRKISQCFVYKCFLIKLQNDVYDSAFLHFTGKFFNVSGGEWAEFTVNGFFLII